MKIAIASNNNIVANHFGHCQKFVLYNIESNKILTETIVPNPGHKPGFLPKYLHEHGIDVIITGGIGSSAIDIFNHFNIDVITGANGEIKNVINKYLDSELLSTNTACHLHKCE